MTEFLPIDLEKIFNPDTLRIALRIAIIIIVGLFTLKISVFFISRAAKRRFSPQSSMIIRKVLFYAGIFIIFILVLKQLGVKLAAILGAAGVAGIAIGFASQTSISNFISGIFLISEKPFSIGDVIKVDSTTGIIISIDLLSVKIRTFDNQFVRIPNEQLIKTQVINITRFAIRRLDITLSIAYKEDIEKVRRILFDIAAKNPCCLDYPEPVFLIQEYSSSGITLFFGVWFQKDDFITVNNTVKMEIIEQFRKEKIEIPFPHISVYAGSKTSPFPIRVAGAKNSKQTGDYM